MNKWNLVIDVGKCHDCNNCYLACKDEHCENGFPPYAAAQPRYGHRWIDLLRKERGMCPRVDVSYLPLPCMQCDDADCIKAGKHGAVYKREDGIVIIDPVKARGQKGIVDSCPYHAIWWNEELQLPQKCTFCVHLLEEGWQAPRCVQACATGALEFLHVEDSDMQRIVASRGLEVLHPEFGLEPRVFYKNLYRYTQCFIAGNVVLKNIDACAEGAKVTLKKGSGDLVATTVANNYGDFRIDHLEASGGTYNLELEYSGYPRQVLSVDLQDTLDIGTVFL